MDWKEEILQAKTAAGIQWGYTQGGFKLKESCMIWGTIIDAEIV